MNTNTLRAITLAVLFFTATALAAAQPVELRLDARKPGAPVQPTMYGLFFEDINHAADGGLYAELVKNRSFDFPQPLAGWAAFGNVSVTRERPPFPRNPAHVILAPAGHPHKYTGIENEGFTGIGLRVDDDYRLTLWAKTLENNAPATLRVELVSAAGDIIGRQDIAITADAWTKYTAIIRPAITDPRGRLRLTLASPAGVAIDHVSLFPVDTYKGRENGLRRDLAELLAATRPGILRFPGGCIVEGADLATRYNWKNSVGDVENRPLNENRWHYTFPHRLFPHYFQSLGLGFYEFFLLAEDIGAEPLPVVSCGLACQFQNDDPAAHAPLDALDEYIQDLLDLVEFANGDTTTTWGALRARMGHPTPFKLKHVAIGNEQWGDEYVLRLAPFVAALRARHPDVKIIGSSGPSADGAYFDHLWPEMRRLRVDLVDEHYYKDPDWFLSSATRYDAYDRRGPAVFAGEYACHLPGQPNNFRAALCEAAFMTGLERNADIVHMATYAPLLAHVDAWQWRPDMIWFDNLRAAPSPSYHVQRLYSINKGTRVVPLLAPDGKPATGVANPATGTANIYASAVLDEPARAYIVKIVHTSADARPLPLPSNLPNRVRSRHPTGA
ncbi:MAG: alpha-L-arabinofuranosidase, partial [Odoribacteraceae bacterium]|nr:alpha-L-arabinofuranosidase [Odoribacteraceae bacterium]